MSLDIRHYWNDLPAEIPTGTSVAVDTEAMGLKHGRDRLCLVQLSFGDGTCHLVQIAKDNPGGSPRLKKLLTDPAIEKIFHFARFDVGLLLRDLGVLCAPVYCTKIASRLVRTYTDRHGLKDLCRDLLGVDLSKAEQTSDWGVEKLTEDQKRYAATDVLHLHGLRKKLDAMLVRENRLHLARACFHFLPHRAELDEAGWEEEDIFVH